MTKFPKIETKRLFLDKLKLEDAPLIAKYASERAISEYTLNIPFPYVEKDALWWINNSFKGFQENRLYTFGIYLKTSSKFIGGIALVLDNKNRKASLGYWLATPFWNKGYMTEATKALLAYGFNKLNINKIYATHLIQNEASGKVMQNAGMIKEGTMVDHFLKEDKFRTVHQFRLTKTEFQKL